MGRSDATANLADASFTVDTATKTGKPERTIQRDATRAKVLGPDLDRVTGTLLGADAPAGMSKPERNEIISRAATGEEVSAIRAARRSRK